MVDCTFGDQTELMNVTATLFESITDRLTSKDEQTVVDCIREHYGLLVKTMRMDEGSCKRVCKYITSNRARKSTSKELISAFLGVWSCAMYDTDNTQLSYPHMTCLISLIFSSKKKAVAWFDGASRSVKHFSCLLDSWGRKMAHYSTPVVSNVAEIIRAVIQSVVTNNDSKYDQRCKGMMLSMILTGTTPPDEVSMFMVGIVASLEEIRDITPYKGTIGWNMDRYICQSMIANVKDDLFTYPLIDFVVRCYMPYPRNIRYLMSSLIDVLKIEKHKPKASIILDCFVKELKKTNVQPLSLIVETLDTMNPSLISGLAEAEYEYRQTVLNDGADYIDLDALLVRRTYIMPNVLSNLKWMIENCPVSYQPLTQINRVIAERKERLMNEALRRAGMTIEDISPLTHSGKLVKNAYGSRPIECDSEQPPTKIKKANPYS